MMPQLSEPFGLSAFTVVLMLNPFYCGRSPFTLVAGAAVDRPGLRTVLPIAAAASLLANTASTGLVPGAWVPIILTSRTKIVFAQPGQASAVDLHSAKQSLDLGDFRPTRDF